MNGWLVVASAAIYVPFGVGYVQSELNKVWKDESVAAQPVEVTEVGSAVGPAPEPPTD